MPNQNPRIKLTVEPAMYDMLRELADMQDRSMASVVVELLKVAQPTLMLTLQAMKAAVAAQDDTRTEVSENLLQRIAELREHGDDLLSGLDADARQFVERRTE